MIRLINPDSPITPQLLVAGAVGITEVVADGLDVYWAESRPDEGGRTTIVRWRDGELSEVTGPSVNVRTRVHEYGGGAWWVADGRLVYSDDAAAGELFLLEVATGDLRQLTSSGHRYADGRFSPGGASFVCVRERHDIGRTVENEIVLLSLEDASESVLLSSHDFFSSPRFSIDGTQLACVAWDHPNMPWDDTELICGQFADGVWEPRPVPGSDESIVLPGWTIDGRLLAVTDRSNWWNLVEVDPKSGDQTPQVTGVFEIATPGWVLGLGRWVETPQGIVAVAGTPYGDQIRFPNGMIETRHTTVNSIRSLSDGRVAYAGSAYGEEAAVWIHDGSEPIRISTPRDLRLGPEYFPAPELVTFDVSAVDSEVRAGTVTHALFYAPAPTSSAGADGSLPALMVLVHGGPTSAARRELSLKIRFWTSRGVAVADVDYRGSTLYGRQYRRSLDGRWGDADVVDCVAVARHFAASGLVDPDRMVIAGGSSGGLTVLNALADHDVFAGGISRYGVTDLSALAKDTHKFEERYLDRLVGPWPEAAGLYAERSPISHAHKITAPMLVVQGLDDKVVPPSQSEAIVEALESNGVTVTYIAFAGEGHGFRSADTIVAALEAELEFMSSL